MLTDTQLLDRLYILESRLQDAKRFLGIEASKLEELGTDIGLLIVEIKKRAIG